jgi:hypothetical protein
MHLLKDGLALLRLAVERMGFSARAYLRILKRSRTIATSRAVNKCCKCSSPKRCSTGRGHHYDR